MKSLMSLVLLFSLFGCSYDFEIKVDPGATISVSRGIHEGATEVVPVGYGFTTRSCSIVKDYFSSKAEFCDGLRNESFNEGCAPEAREETWQAECGPAASELRTAPESVELFYDTEPGKTDKPVRFGYEITTNSCTTGTKEFDTRMEYCEGLRSRAFNSGCAPEGRDELWQKQCAIGAKLTYKSHSTNSTNPLPSPQDFVQSGSEFRVGDCTTGKKTFASKAEYCAILRSRSSNNDCAQDVRKDKWLEECGSEYSETL
jgi:hypothetical protein